MTLENYFGEMDWLTYSSSSSAHLKFGKICNNGRILSSSRHKAFNAWWDRVVHVTAEAANALRQLSRESTVTLLALPGMR